MPFTAPMTGFHRSLDFGPSQSPGSSYMKLFDVPYSAGPSSSAVNGSFRSMPVQNALSPLPVSTTTRMSSSARSASHRVRQSCCIPAVKALWASGRFSVTVATWSSTSTSSVSNS